jgi:hypothetical protein
MATVAPASAAIRAGNVEGKHKPPIIHRVLTGAPLRQYQRVRVHQGALRNCACRAATRDFHSGA